MRSDLLGQLSGGDGWQAGQRGLELPQVTGDQRMVERAGHGAHREARSARRPLPGVEVVPRTPLTAAVNASQSARKEVR